MAGGTLGAISGGQQTWTASLSVNDDTDVVISVAASTVIDGSGTPSVATSATGPFASGTIAEEVIREFLGARSAALIAAQPGLSGLLDNAAPSGNISVTHGVGAVQLRAVGAAWTLGCGRRATAR